MTQNPIPALATDAVREAFQRGLNNGHEMTVA